MPSKPKSLIKIADFDKNSIDKVFKLTKELKEANSEVENKLAAKNHRTTDKYTVNNADNKLSNSPQFKNALIALLFFESSTRTRISFESACVREGYFPSVLIGGAGSSMDKGESIEDTILNVHAMEPRALVIRVGSQVDLIQLKQKLNIPIINAGWGASEHPTQALLDAYTIREKLGAIEGVKLLIVGDIKHSRVASSHMSLSKILGYKLAFCGPKELIPENKNGEFPVFEKLEEGLSWCDSIMALRNQFERHQQKLSVENYLKEFGLTQKKLLILKKSGLIMHPGPINRGIDLEEDILHDSRSVIMDQVTNGVYLRQAVIRFLLEEQQ